MPTFSIRWICDHDREDGDRVEYYRRPSSSASCMRWACDLPSITLPGTILRMTDPLVSVIVPVHNGDRYLGEALDSALNQDYDAIEVIVVDDGSTDGTPEVLRRFGNRIVAIRQENAGAAVARNTAMEAARGEFFAFLDADDLWFPQKLRTQIDYLSAHPAVDIVASRWKVLTSDESTTARKEALESAPLATADVPRSGWLYTELLLRFMIHTTTVVMRRRLKDRIGLFDPILRRGQDYEYWLRASRATEIHCVPEALSVYRMHRANSTRRPLPVNYGAVIVKRALQTWGRTGPDGRTARLVDVRRRLSDIWFSFGYQHLTYGNSGVALGCALKGVSAWPLDPNPWRLLAACALAPLRRNVET